MPGQVGCASDVGIECCEFGAPKGAERFQSGHEALGRGRLPPGWKPQPPWKSLPLNILRPILAPFWIDPFPVAQSLNPSNGQRVFLAADALHLDQPSSAHWGEQRPRKYDILTNPFSTG